MNILNSGNEILNIEIEITVLKSRFDREIGIDPPRIP